VLLKGLFPFLFQVFFPRAAKDGKKRKKLSFTSLELLFPLTVSNEFCEKGTPWGVITTPMLNKTPTAASEDSTRGLP
jgi:hypothetical protein